MLNFLKKQKKIVSVLLLIFLVSVFGILTPNFKRAKAEISLIDFGFGVIAKALAGIGAFFHSIVSLCFSIVAILFDIALSLEKFTKAGIVLTGWEITRDLVNMFFVLVLLIIAFATILRIEPYEAKQIIRNLIIIALLINFSLVICGVIIDSSQILTHFFYDEIKGDIGVSGKLANILKIQKFYEINEKASIPSKLAAGASGNVMMFFSIFMGIILILSATLAIGIGAFFLIIRMIAIWILLILSPIAWFFGILPLTKNLAKQWWSSFLKWTFFAPIYVFFIWLAIKAGEAGDFTKMVKQETESLIVKSNIESVVFSEILASPSRLLLQFIVIIFILFGGLIIAQKLSIYGAQGAMGFAKKAGKGTAGWTGKQAWTRFGAPTTKTAEEKLTKVGADWEGKKGWKGAIARGAGRVVGQIARAPRAAVEAERKAMAGLEAKYKPRTSDHLKSDYVRAATPRDKVAIAKELAKRGDLEKDEARGFTEKYIQESAALAKRYEAHSDIIKARLDLAPLVGKSEQKPIEAIAEKSSKMKPSDMEKIQIESFVKIKPDGTKEINKNVLEATTNQLIKKATGTEPNQGKWKSNNLSKMAETNPGVLNIIMEGINNKIKTKSDWDNLEKERPDIANFLKSSPGISVCGELDIIKTLPKEKPKEKPIISSSTESEFKKAKEEGYRGK